MEINRTLDTTGYRALLRLSVRLSDSRDGRRDSPTHHQYPTPRGQKLLGLGVVAVLGMGKRWGIFPLDVRQLRRRPLDP